MGCELGRYIGDEVRLGAKTIGFIFWRLGVVFESMMMVRENTVRGWGRPWSRFQG